MLCGDEQCDCVRAVKFDCPVCPVSEGLTETDISDFVHELDNDEKEFQCIICKTEFIILEFIEGIEYKIRQN